MSVKKSVLKNDTTAVAKSAIKIANKPTISVARAEDSASAHKNHDTDATLIAKSMTLRESQYRDITSLAAYNKLMRKKPDTVSGVVREALDYYLAATDDSYRTLVPHL